jgi:hypothetical protein
MVYKKKHYGVRYKKTNEKGESSLTHAPVPKKIQVNFYHLMNNTGKFQRATFTKEETFIDPDRFLDAKVNSDFLEKLDVKANVDKHTYNLILK